MLRLALGCAALAFALLQSDGGCGFRDDDPKGPGEPCTRSSECRFDLSCSGGVCTEELMDAGPPPDSGPRRDGGGPSDAEVGVDGSGIDAALDAGAAADAAPDAAPLDAGPLDAGPLDAGPLDAGPLDAGPLDGGDADAGPTDAGFVDSGPDAGPIDAGL